MHGNNAETLISIEPLRWHDQLFLHADFPLSADVLRLAKLIASSPERETVYQPPWLESSEMMHLGSLARDILERLERLVGNQTGSFNDRVNGKLVEPLQRALDRGYAQIDQSTGRRKLILPKVTPDSPVLFHQTLPDQAVSKGVTDHGVIGDPRSGFLTCLREPNCMVKTTPRLPGSRVILMVDAVKLAAVRSIFIDPEAIPIGPDYQPGKFDFLGKTFTVSGGIPANCVIDAREAFEN